MKQSRVFLFILFLVSFLIYSNTLNHDYVLDDFSVIKENFLVKKGTGEISTLWKTHYRYGYGYQQATLYRPLALSLFALQWQLAPDSPSFAHWFNVLLYALTVCIIFLFLRELWGKTKILLTFITCLLFATHPIHTEVVANIKSVDDILVMFFSTTALLFLLKYIENKKTHLFIASLSLVGLSFFTKESTITLVATIPFILILFRSFSVTKALKTVAWYLIPFFIYLFARIQVLGSISGDKNIAELDNMLVMAPNGLTRIATALKIMGLYVWKLVYPHPLMNDYSFSQIEFASFSNPFVWLSILVYGLLIFVIIKFWNSRKILVFSILFFLVTISLYSNLLITIGTSFGERLLFIPSLGFAIALAYGITHPFNQKIKSTILPKTAKPILLIAVVLAGIYSFKTIDRNKDWENNFTLYTTDVKKCDKSARCQYHNGISLMKNKAVTAQNETEKKKYLLQAINAFNKAITILPNYSDAYADRGLAYYRLKNYQEAEKSYLKATQLNAANASAFSNLGSLYFDMRKYQNAKQAYGQALRINPNYVDALANYGSTLGTLGEFNAAITYFKKAIAINPNEPNYYQMIGVTYQNLGNKQQAQIYLQKAQQLRNLK